MITTELIEKYKKLAYKIAMPYLIGFPSIADDLEASAMLGLCAGIKDAIKKKHHSPLSLIIFNVQFEIIKCLQSSYCIIRLPRSLIRKKKLEAYLAKEEFSIAKLYPEIILLVEQHTGTNDYIGWRKIKQEISEIDLTDLERKVLVYKLSDYTYREIGEALDYSHVGIQKIMERVRKKWLKQIK